jgi:signal transduction histidine kinase
MERFDLFYLLNAVFTGIFAVFGVYHLIGYLILKQKILLYYSLFILGLTLHWSLYLIAKSSVNNTVAFVENLNKVSLLTAMITTFGLLMYTKDYLNISKDDHPRLFGAYTLFLAVVICLPPLYFLNILTLDQKELNDAMVMLAAFTSLGAIVLNLISGFRLDSGQKINRYYLFSYTPILLAALLYIGAWFWQQYYDFDASNLVFISSVLITLQLILFSIIISLKFKAIEDENLEIQIASNEFLTAEVKKQTQNLYDAKTKLERQNEELERVNQLKNRLFSLLTHDVRGPLNNITALVALIEEEVVPSELKQMTQKLQIQIHNRVSLVNDLLEWSYQQLEGITVTKSTCAIENVFLAVAKDFEQMASEKKIGIEMAVEWPQLFIDENMFKIMLRNLISNALKFSFEGQKIILSSQQTKDAIEVAVQDFGLGMDTDWYRKLEEGGIPSTRAGTSGEKGTGFGLLITKDFVEMNGGELICTSRMGKGTTFILRFERTGQKDHHA